MKRALISTVVVAGLLAFAGRPAAAQEPDPKAFLEVVSSYLTVINQTREIASNPQAALMLAQNSIKEIYQKKGQPTAAVPELRKILEGVDDVAVRTAVRFAISDIYKETGQPDRALAELRLVVAENKAVLAKANANAKKR